MEEREHGLAQDEHSNGQSQLDELAPLDALAALFEQGPVALLTGAGVSTDSGIPDYRGEGAPVRNPMQIDQFMTDNRYRQRFWGGARMGLLDGDRIRPNLGHQAAARLEQAGLLSGVITQNTDNLHRRAGSKEIAELHGNGAVIRCVEHGHRWKRAEVLAWFDAANPGFAQRHKDSALNPDGDAAVGDVADVNVPVCPACGGTLRPDIVYFGEHVPLDTFAKAEEILEGAQALLIAGSSLAVNTPIRIIHRAEKRPVPIGVINRGPTAIDGRDSVTVRVEGGTSDWLEALATRLGA